MCIYMLYMLYIYTLLLVIFYYINDYNIIVNNENQIIS